MPGKASRPRTSAAAKAGAEIRGDVLRCLAQLRLATPRQLKSLLLPHHQDTRLRPSRAAQPARRPAGRPDPPRPAELLVLHARRPRRSRRLRLTPAEGRTDHRSARGREDWTARAHPRPGRYRHRLPPGAGGRPYRLATRSRSPHTGRLLVPDGVVLLDDGSHAFVEIDRTMSYARLVAKLERYDAYRSAPPSGRGNAARAPRSHWEETYSGPPL
ncbi:replication-relaxation family protein [Streptomyces deserti]